MNQTKSNSSICHYCDGQGYIEIRDCTGEIQREETCVFCGGTGKPEVQDAESLQWGHC